MPELPAVSSGPASEPTSSRKEVADLSVLPGLLSQFDADQGPTQVLLDSQPKSATLRHRKAKGDKDINQPSENRRYTLRKKREHPARLMSVTSRTSFF